jgi:hypothetical protein
MGVKYEREGHFHTTDLVGEMAGLDKIKRDRLAYFSQAPDDLAFKYSAPWVAVWGVAPPHWSYRSSIMNVLHSLHGGSHKEIISRREKLKEQIKTLLMHANGDADDWKIGFLIHALGDSYAHVYGEMDNLYAYGEFMGHAYDQWSMFANKPDEIVENNNYLIYIDYVQALFEALSAHSNKPNRRMLDVYIAEVREKVEKERVSNEQFIKFIQDYVLCDGIIEKAKSESYLETARAQEDWKREIDFSKVSAFLDEIRRSL